MNDLNISDSGCERIAACFHDLTPDELKYINQNKTEVDYLAGETLFKQEAFSPHVLLITEGLVKVYLQTGPEKQLNLFIQKESDFLAFSSVFGEQTHNYSAVALTDVQICMIDKESMRKVLLSNPNFAMRITSRNCKNEKQFLSIMHNITYRQMRGKLASALLYLSDEDFAGIKIFPRLGRQDIANFASIATESAIKFLKEFEKEGIIKLKGKDIEIVNRAQLELIERLG